MSSANYTDFDSTNQASAAIDCAAFVTEALTGAAANAGGIDTILSGRPGSWEASAVRDALGRRGRARRVGPVAATAPTRSSSY